MWAQTSNGGDRTSKVVDIILAEERKIVTEHIQLTEDEAKAFWPTFDEYQKTMGNFLPKIIKLINKYVHTHKMMSDEQANAIIDEVIDMQEEKSIIYKKYLKKFRKVLPPKKMLTLL